MDANDIMNAINGILDIGDTLDNSGIGVKALTNGKNTEKVRAFPRDVAYNNPNHFFTGKKEPTCWISK